MIGYLYDFVLARGLGVQEIHYSLEDGIIRFKVLIILNLEGRLLLLFGVVEVLDVLHEILNEGLVLLKMILVPILVGIKEDRS